MSTQNTQQEAREAMVQQRQEEEHLHQSMLNRTTTEVSASESEIQAEARELMVENCHEQEHLEQTMLNRAAAEVGIDPPASAS